MRVCLRHINQLALKANVIIHYSKAFACTYDQWNHSLYSNSYQLVEAILPHFYDTTCVFCIVCMTDKVIRLHSAIQVSAWESTDTTFL